MAGKKNLKALIVHGGWEGHEPKQVAKIFERELKKAGVDVEVSNTLGALDKVSPLKQFDVIIPHWTMGEISLKQWQNLDKAVCGGVGVAGVHGGAGDAFRRNLSFQWMIGGQFVGHPHVGDYEVRLTETANPITAGMPTSFEYNSEQYYQIVDPGVNVLAATTYDYDGHKVDMPCIWTKTWGKGRVFYSALGHGAKEFITYPHMRKMTIRGMLWAAAGKDGN
jgi:hypothetical protein